MQGSQVKDVARLQAKGKARAKPKPKLDPAASSLDSPTAPLSRCQPTPVTGLEPPPTLELCVEHVCAALRALLWAGRFFNPWNAKLELLNASAAAEDPAVPHLQPPPSLTGGVPGGGFYPSVRSGYRLCAGLGIGGPLETCGRLEDVYGALLSMPCVPLLGRDADDAAV